MARSLLCRSLTVIAIFAGAAAFGATPGSRWISLFNGKDLDGWEQLNGKAKYEAKDGVILGSSVPNSPNSFLCTKKHYGDFELEFDVKCDAPLNSGVQIRSESSKSYQNGRVHGYQVEIAVDGFSGGIYDEARRAKFLNANTPTKKDTTDAIRKLLKADQWNHYRVVCQGDHIQTWVNGVQVTDLHDGMTASGFIGLQVHGVGTRTDPLHVAFRNLRLRELPPKLLKSGVVSFDDAKATQANWGEMRRYFTGETTGMKDVLTAVAVVKMKNQK